MGEESPVSAVSFLAAGAVAVLSAALGGELGQLGLEAAGAVMQGELNELRKDIQVQRQAELSLSLATQQPDTSVAVSSAETEEKKDLATIQEHPDREEVINSYR